MAFRQGDQLPLPRCPHCAIAKPAMPRMWNGKSTSYAGKNKRDWSVYMCSSCGGFVLSCAAESAGGVVSEYWPTQRAVADSIPERPKHYLEQAIASIHAPAGAVMLAASAVDAMLQSKNLKDGSLYARIDLAVKGGLITPEMASWAHEVRLDANAQRHADETLPLPSEDDAERVVEFAMALAQFLLVLPARIAEGRAKVSPE